MRLKSAVNEAAAFAQPCWGGLPNSLNSISAIFSDFSAQRERVQFLLDAKQVLTELSDDRSFDAPLHMQGNPAMYNDAAFIQRTLSKLDLRVLQLVEKIWALLPHENCCFHDDFATSVVTYPYFVYLMLKIAKMLRPEEREDILLTHIQAEWDKLAQPDPDDDSDPPGRVFTGTAFAESMLDVVYKYIIFIYAISMYRPIYGQFPPTRASMPPCCRWLLNDLTNLLECT